MEVPVGSRDEPASHQASADSATAGVGPACGFPVVSFDCRAPPFDTGVSEAVDWDIADEHRPKDEGAGDWEVATSKRVVELSTASFEALPSKCVGHNALPAPWHELAHLNRYLDIIPTPQSRVPLGKAEGDTAYINANFVRGFDGSEKAYIATQGATKATIAHFWQMVWEQGATTIVMLTGLIELGRPKCERYWPTGVGSEFEARHGDLLVTVACVEEFDSYTRSVLHVRNGEHSDDTLTVNHFWFNTWPDLGTPEEVTGVLDMLEDVRRHSDGCTPWVVHCSAGIGRTGTFIAIDMGSRQLKSHGRTDVLELIRAMREDRGGMVQTDAQATFVHRALMDVASDLPELSDS